ncbi:peptidoglycan D,D-transpeptidase FtsI family protein [Marinicella sp. W31]|uniref:peptidoglycan D,D-transpeptidase FtsI family protein n=1 Tax=Marinicella sp. W31 TaxID=3023713 RepID=UPI003756D008
MKRKVKNNVNTQMRMRLILFFLGCCFVVIVGRAFSIQIRGKDFYQQEGEMRHVREMEIPVSRGTIYDRNGEPLALSTAMQSVGIEPQHLIDQFSKLEQLAELLEVDVEKLKQLVTTRANKKFLFIKRHITPGVADAIRALNMKGVDFRTEFKRYYPAGEILAQVIGFTSIDDQGQEGLELTYDQWLSGVSGKKTVVKDLHGQMIDAVDVQELLPAKPGKDLHLSIDRRLQYSAYLALKKTVYQYKAESASAVIMDVHTGEILAMVNQPSFNPNGNKKNNKGLRNRALADIYEPGSVVKPFAVIAALESGQYTSNTVVPTAPGYFEIDGYKINDFRDYGDLTVTEILMKSSNVGVAKLALDIGKEHIWDLYSRFGLGQSTSSGFVGESGGYLPDYKRWRESDHAAVSRGYGLQVTTLQLASAYAAIANNGRFRSPSFIKGVINEDRAIIDPPIAMQLKAMLDKVVSVEGTGSRAMVPNYSVAGKTGTARKAEKGGYSDKYIASFVGFAPVDNPRLVVAVSVNDPKGDDYSGSLVGAPLFAEIMKNGLRMLNVPADQVETTVVSNAGVAQ